MSLGVHAWSHGKPDSAPGSGYGDVGSDAVIVAAGEAGEFLVDRGGAGGSAAMFRWTAMVGP